MVPFTDIAGCSPLNFFNLKFLLLCVWVPNGVTIFQFRSDNHLSTLTFVIYRHSVTLFTRDAD